MTVTRTMDAAFLNRVANHPDVRPYIGGEGPVDLAPILADAANYALVTEGGGWLLQPLMPGAYELHTLIVPKGRGRPFFAAAREALRWMFTRTDALEILTRCPDNNPGARMAATLMGFRERFHRDNAWAPGVGVSYQAFTLDDWMARDRSIEKSGHEFSSSLGINREDEAHDRAMGAAILMMMAAQTAKAVAVFNRIAAFAGYVPMAAYGPATIGTGDAVLEIVDGAISVLMVRSDEPRE